MAPLAVPRTAVRSATIAGLLALQVVLATILAAASSASPALPDPVVGPPAPQLPVLVPDPVTGGGVSGWTIATIVLATALAALLALTAVALRHQAHRTAPAAGH